MLNSGQNLAWGEIETLVVDHRLSKIASLSSAISVSAFDTVGWVTGLIR